MPSPAEPDQQGPVLFLILLVMASLVLVAWGLSPVRDRAQQPAAAPASTASATPSAPEPSAAPTPSPVPTPAPTALTAPTAPTSPSATPTEPDAAPAWRQRVFAGNRFLVAYYGTAGSGALGVLGETAPDTMHRRLMKAARPFARPGRPVQPVYELIVTIADATPGPDGDYSHDIAKRDVRRYIAAARRNGALVVLDLQTGRSNFLKVAKRWRWALLEPHVGLALDPEWRMGPGQVPGRVIGSVRALEVNRTSLWLAQLVRRNNLPEKPFVLHQFRSSMLPDIERIRPRNGLAMIQHADGFGTRGQKLSTYAAIARPGQFAMGWKLFYDEDINLMGAAGVHAIRPRVRFISFQ